MEKWHYRKDNGSWIFPQAVDGERREKLRRGHTGSGQTTLQGPTPLVGIRYLLITILPALCNNHKLQATSNNEKYIRGTEGKKHFSKPER